MLTVTPQIEEPVITDPGLTLTRNQQHYAEPETQAAISRLLASDGERVKRSRELVTLGAGVLLLVAIERILANHKGRKSGVIQNAAMGLDI